MEPLLPAAVIAADAGLVCAPLSVDDAPACWSACQDPEIHRWIPLPRPYTRALALDWCGGGAEARRRAGGASTFGMHLTSAGPDASEVGTFAGCISLSHPNRRDGIVEIGYWVAPGLRRRGIARRAVTALTMLAFESGFARVELRIAPANHASLAVARACGFVAEGTLRSAGVVHGGRTDLVVHSRLIGDPR